MRLRHSSMEASFGNLVVVTTSLRLAVNTIMNSTPEGMRFLHLFGKTAREYAKLQLMRFFIRPKLHAT